jgi:hypothetical protein
MRQESSTKNRPTAPRDWILPVSYYWQDRHDGMPGSFAANTRCLAYLPQATRLGSRMKLKAAFIILPPL